MIPCAKSTNGGLTVARKAIPDKRASLLEQQKAIAAKLRAIDLSERKLPVKITRALKYHGVNRADGYREKPAKPLANRVRELLNQFVEPRDRHLFPFLPPVEVAKAKPPAQNEVIEKPKEETKGGFFPQEARG